MSSVNPYVQNEIELSGYLEEWGRNYYARWNDFYHDANQNKRALRAQLSNVDTLLDLLDSLIGNVEEYFSIAEDCHLIPSSFASVDKVISWLGWMKEYINKHIPIVEENYKKVGTHYFLGEIYRMMYEFVAVVDRCQKVYASDSALPLPYHQLRESLIKNDVPDFMDKLKSVVSGIPYSVRKECYNESFFHITVHTIMTILGFSPLSEDSTNKGRIDMVITLGGNTYIFEFKYSKKKSLHKEALKQIIDKDYALKYKLGSSRIVGVGVGFTEAERGIYGYCFETLYENSAIKYKSRN